MKICDLHTHSVFSDGTYTPARLLTAAEALGLSAVALCDHNTVDGLPDFLAAAKGSAVEAIAGAEFSVDLDGTELHLLALFIDPKYFPDITERMEEVTERKRQSNQDLIRSLNRAGYSLDYEAIRRSTPNGKFNRAHIAAELTRKGYTPSIKQAFDTLLSPTKGFYKEPKRLTVWEMLDYVNQIGAVSVLAHPFLNLDEEKLEAFLPRAKEAGLVGMECFYSLYDEKTTRRSLALADKYGLLYSGGSDFHGSNKPNISLGTGQGDLRIPDTWATALAQFKRF